VAVKRDGPDEPTAPERQALQSLRSSLDTWARQSSPPWQPTEASSGRPGGNLDSSRENGRCGHAVLIRALGAGKLAGPSRYPLDPDGNRLRQRGRDSCLENNRTKRLLIAGRGWVSGDIDSPMTPAVVNGVVFAVSGGAPRSSHAVLYAFDGANGKELWNGGATIATSTPPNGGVSTGNSQIYVAGADGYIYAFGFPMEH